MSHAESCLEGGYVAVVEVYCPAEVDATVFLAEKAHCGVPDVDSDFDGEQERLFTPDILTTTRSSRIMIPIPMQMGIHTLALNKARR